jgi:hypothetical protein
LKALDLPPQTLDFALAAVHHFNGFAIANFRTSHAVLLLKILAFIWR